jgi:hypothetical protein
MQNKPRRYFGMTCMQAIVLTVLGLLALGGMGFAAKLILGNGLPVGTAQVPPTQVAVVNFVPLPTSTSLPSSTPVLPTQTFTATTYASLIPEGWNQYKYDKVEMWMPADFVKKSSKDALVYAENKNESGNGFIVSVGLTKDTPAETDLDDYIQKGLVQFTPETTFLEKKKFQVGSYEAIRLKMQAIINNIPMGEAIYFIKDGGNIWIVGTISHYDEFHKWLPIFDQIVRTFRINP